MATQGPLFPSVGADDATVGAVAWVNPTRITADDASSADVTLNANQISHYIKGTGFAFSIPAGATINGITLEAKVLSQGGGGGISNENSIKLVKGGVIGGTEKSTAANLPTGALAYVTYGGVADLWGLAWTPADINAANFGAVFSCHNTNGISSSDPFIDAMRITVTYTPAASSTPQRTTLGVGT